MILKFQVTTVSHTSFHPALLKQNSCPWRNSGKDDPSQVLLMPRATSNGKVGRSLSKVLKQKPSRLGLCQHLQQAPVEKAFPAIALLTSSEKIPFSAVVPHSLPHAFPFCSLSSFSPAFSPSFSPYLSHLSPIIFSSTSLYLLISVSPHA